MDSLCVSIYKIISCVNKDKLTYSYLIALAQTSSTLLNKLGGILVLLQSEGERIQSFTIRYDNNYRGFVHSLYQLWKVPLYSYSVYFFFFLVRMCIRFGQMLFLHLWSGLCCFCTLLMHVYTDCFLDVKPALHS